MCGKRVLIAECLEKEEKERKKERKKKEKQNLSKKHKRHKNNTHQSSTGLLYHPTVSFFSFIWSLSPK